MKIVFIHNSYQTEITSGAQRIIKTLADYLIFHQHEVVIITCGDKKLETRQDGLIKVISLPSKFHQLAKLNYIQRLGFHLGGFFNLKAYFRLKKILAQEKCDLVWTHNLVGFGLISFRAIKAKVKFHTCHDIQLLHPSGLLIYQQEDILNSISAKIYQLLVKLVLPKDSLIIFPSQWLKNLSEKFKLFPHQRVMVLANPVFLADKNFNLPTPTNFTFLYLGQLEEHKGIKLLIKAFEKLDNNCQLLVAGSGGLLNELQQTTDQRIKFLGKVNNPLAVMSQANCVVVPSLCYENFPTAVLEALEVNIPVVASELGGTKELLTNEKLLFLPTEQAIVDKLTWCLANQEELKNVAQLNKQQIKLNSAADYLSMISDFTGLTF